MASVLLAPILSAQNPITPPGTYLADPSAHQWKDGKVYVYGSSDEVNGTYCSRFYDVLSSSDLIQWTMHQDVFASVGNRDEVDYSDNLLYAPDCLEKDGKYYLYYCMSGGGEDEGVAVGKSPVGPFKSGKRIKGISQIDPAAFVDDDGKAYLYWGQFSAKVARLKPEMNEVDLSTMCQNILTEKEHHFHEGIQMIKRNGIYYLIYAHIGRRGQATCIGYSMGNTPIGPFRYGGVIIDNFGCDPNVWNNHGSIAEVNGKWYVFYHRATEGGATMRKACIEPIEFNADGTINEVEMTTQGAAGPLNPFMKMEAERACYLTGHVRTHTCDNKVEALVEIRHLDTAAFKYFDFKKRPCKITLQLTSKRGGKIEVYANNLCRPLLATLEVPSSDGVTPLRLTKEIASELTGIAPIYMRFKGEADADLFNVDWFVFE